MEATRQVVKRITRCKDPRVREAFDSLVQRLRDDPQYVPPDKRAVWRKAFPGMPNHRHANLPDGWRAAWSVVPRDQDVVVVVIFVGTHKEYEKTYGFRTQ